MITSRLDNPELLHTLERAVRHTVKLQGSILTVREWYQHLEVTVELPEGYTWSYGHSAFSMNTETAECSHLDVWHDVLVAISYPVWRDLDDDACECATVS